MIRNDEYNILNEPLPSESHRHEELKWHIARAEALGNSVAIALGKRAKEIAKLDHDITRLRTESLVSNKDMKVAIAEAVADDAVADIVQQRTELDAEIRHLKYVQKLIENRCSIGQSFLSNITSQIKAGINLPTLQDDIEHKL